MQREHWTRSFSLSVPASTAATPCVLRACVNPQWKRLRPEVSLSHCPQCTQVSWSPQQNFSRGTVHSIGLDSQVQHRCMTYQDRQVLTNSIKKTSDKALKMQHLKTSFVCSHLPCLSVFEYRCENWFDIRSGAQSWLVDGNHCCQMENTVQQSQKLLNKQDTTIIFCSCKSVRTFFN